MKVSLFISVLLISASAFAAALCPVDSCNPHNGCVEGCSSYRAFDSATCTPEDPKLGESEAIRNAANYAHSLCRSGYFLRSDKWSVRTEVTNNSCTVQAEAYVSCYQ